MAEPNSAGTKLGQGHVELLVVVEKLLISLPQTVPLMLAIPLVERSTASLATYVESGKEDSA